MESQLLNQEKTFDWKKTVYWLQFMLANTLVYLFCLQIRFVYLNADIYVL